MGGETQTGMGETIAPLSRFQVRPGCRFGAANQYGPGDVVLLADADAAAFADKLEPVNADDAGDLAPAPIVVPRPRRRKGDG